MRLITSAMFFLVSAWVFPVYAEDGECIRRWSVGAGFSLAKANVNYEPLGEVEGLAVLTCPLPTFESWEWEWYLEGGLGATTHRGFVLPFGVGILAPVANHLHFGLSATWHTQVYPEIAGSALFGLLFEWQVTPEYGVVFVPGYVLHVNRAERAHGWGGIFSLEF